MSTGSAIVTAAGGIGDIIRMTPLVRALWSMGYEVDFLLAPDYLGTVKLFEGASAIRQLFYVPSQWSQQTERRIEGLGDRNYDVATFTVWSSRLRDLVVAGHAFAFDQREWIQDGDIACSRRIAGTLGWSGPMPAPFVIPSARDFGLLPGTVALPPAVRSSRDAICSS